MATPTRQQVGFPTVANVRKGTPKRKMKKNGRDIEIMGLDLKSKFRIDFLPGTQDVRRDWHALHEKDYVKYPDNSTIADGYEVTLLNARVPSASIWDSWTWFNETYDASGRLIARADFDHYIVKKDPLTGEKLISDSKPYEKFNVGDAITYERDGKKYGLAMRSTGRLKLFLPELGRFVSFLLRTSSYIDSLYIHEHLGAIQSVADFLNDGIAGGIPLDIYRVERDSPYQKDGQSHKGKQWFIHIEANKEWVQAAINRMSKFALGETVVGMLQPVNIDMDNLPEQAFTETDDEVEPETVQPENVVDVVATESTPARAPAGGPISLGSMTYDEAKHVIVKVKGGKEKFMGELTKEQLDYVIEKSILVDKVEAAKIVLANDFQMVDTAEGEQPQSGKLF